MTKLPDGWKQQQLNDIASIVMGQSPPSSTYNIEKKGLPFFQGKAEFGNRYPEIKLWCDYPAKVAPQWSILFSVRAPVGDVNITRWDACIGRGLSAIKAKSADQEFIFQYLLFCKSEFQLLAQGSTFEAINGDELKSFTIPIPPLAEQKKIAEILSSVDRSIEATGKLIAKLSDLKKALMQELFTKGIGHTKFKDSPLGRIPEEWEVVSVGDCCNICNTLRRPINSQDRCEMIGKYPYYGPTGIQGYINEYRVEGKFALIGEDGDHFLKWFKRSMTQLVSGRFNVNNHAHIVMGRSNCLTEWFYLFFQQRDICNFLTRQGAGRYKLNKASLESILMFLPSIDEQWALYNILSSNDAKTENAQKRLDKLKDMKKGLMQDLLTGKVRVKV